MKENRNNSRDSRRATVYHERKIDRPIVNYDTKDYSDFLRSRRLESHPMILPNPLGAAFGYMILPAMVRRSN